MEFVPLVVSVVAEACEIEEDIVVIISEVSTEVDDSSSLRPK